MKSHNKFRFIFIAVMMFSLVFAGDAVAKSPNKVDVCQNDGKGGYELVKVKVDTLQAHLSHGDVAIGGAVPGQPGMVFGAKCSLVSTAGNPQVNSVTTVSTTNNGKKTDKVNVCHRRGNETFILININGNALSAHLAHGDHLAEGLVSGAPGGKVTAECSTVEEPERELVQSLTVPSTSDIPVPSDALEKRQLYEIKAMGTYTYDPEKDWADAEWHLTGGEIVKGEDSPSLPPNVLDLAINGCKNNTNWGDYQEDHIYTIEWTGKGKPLTFTICDVFYGDNEGSLTVEIWKINR